MGIPKSKATRFTPIGLCDAFDSSSKFPGACRSLANLVFDQGNPDLCLPRPGVVTLADLGSLGIASPGFISIQQTIGSRVYGMVASSRNPGSDEPFIYDTATGALVSISGIASTNVPTSPPTSGDWTPPTMSSVGTFVIFTHPGFTGANGAFFGVLNVAPTPFTWNPSDKGAGVTLSNGNLSYSATANNTVRATQSLSAGKLYWTVQVTSGTVLVGVARAGATLAGFLGSDALGWSYAADGTKFNSGSSSAYGAAFGAGDVIGIAVDTVANTVTFTKNGVSQGVAFTGVTGPLFPAASGGGAASGGAIANFGGTAFAFAPPSGYGSLAAPFWSAQNTTGVALTGVPSAVANLNNRAYFAVGNLLQFTDALSLNRTNANQSLTIGDNSSLVALAGLPVQTTSSGIVSSLLAWKASQIWQITGDITTLDLSLNYLSLTVGTTSPRTIAQPPSGVYFLSQAGGPYVIDPLGNVRSLTHDLTQPDPDVQVPFQNATTPSRWAGAYIASVYRVCGPTVLLGGSFVNDYWFDEHRRRWNGPHSFAYDCASGMGSNFILSSTNNPGLLLTSAPIGNSTSVYTDLGTTIMCLVQSATFPNVGEMAIKQVVESQVELGGYPSGATYTLTAQDENGALLGPSVAITVPGTGLPLWGGAGLTWGAPGLLWTSSFSQAPYTYAVPWTTPLVFEKLALGISVTAGPNVQIGTFYARYQKTGYMTMKAGA